MTPFQWIVGGFLVTALVIELLLQLMGMTRRRISLLRTLVWFAALVLVLNPDLLQNLAVRLRVGRGADFLLYLLALSFPVACFYFLHAIEQQRIQLTRLVRELAHRNPMHTPESRSQTDSMATTDLNQLAD
jgi:hypothetical protein